MPLALCGFDFIAAVCAVPFAACVVFSREAGLPVEVFEAGCRWLTCCFASGDCADFCCVSLSPDESL